MSLLQNSNAISTGGGYNLESSLRFRSSASAYLTRTLSASGTTNTWSFWVKRGKLSSGYQSLFDWSNAVNTSFGIVFTSSDTLDFYNYSSAYTMQLVTAQLFRDPSAWYHIVVVMDTTNATASDRARIYVNGNRVTTFSTATYPTQNLSLNIATSRAFDIGALGATHIQNFDGYMTEFNFVDGQALTADDFGEYDEDTGVWKPKRYAGSYGTNGFYLDCNTKDNINITNSLVSGGNGGIGSISCNVGDLILVLGGDADTSPGTQSASGVVLTEVASTANAQSASRLYYGYATSTTVSTSSSTLDGNIIIAIEGGQFSSYAVANNTSGDAIPPTLSANIESDDYIFVLGAFDRNVTVNSTSSGYTLIGNNNNDITMAAVYKTGINATSETPGTWTNTSDGWAVYTIHVKRIPIVGADTSGNNNNWTTNNINYTAPFETTYDIMNDVPTLTDEDTANFPTLNPLLPSDVNGADTNLQNGNLTSATYSASYNTWSVATWELPPSGKYYWEVNIDSAVYTADWSEIGLLKVDAGDYLQPASNSEGRMYAGYYGYKLTYLPSPLGGSSYGASYGPNDTIGIAVDMDNSAIYFSKNNTWQNSGVPTSGASKTGAAFTDITNSAKWMPASYTGSQYGSIHFNFGQRPFKYTPPTGYKKLNTYNLPDSTIVDGSQYFDTSTWTGTGLSKDIQTPFSPDLVWIKDRVISRNHVLIDTVRGNDKTLVSNSLDSEYTFTNTITSFNSDGYTILNSAFVNSSGNAYVGWSWRGSDSSPVSNTNGTITSTVSANTNSGFSVVTWTGTGSAGATIGHGLGSTPQVIINKGRSYSQNWEVYHSALGPTKWLQLNSTVAQLTETAIWNNTAPTSSIFTVGSSAAINPSGGTNVTYCFAEVEGFSKFGSCIGNGSTNGPFVYTGFKPSFIIIKASSSTGSWLMFDNKRNTYNPVNALLYSNYTNNESILSPPYADFVSNGFKIRRALTNGTTYIYMAFAENPFKQSLAR